MNARLSTYSVISLILAGLSLCISIFVPIWRIDLDAPQYPEGLRLLIHANKLGGDVEIVNGLNHYIGMKTLHAEEFIEFTVLPYIIGFFALLSIITGLRGNKKWVFTLLGLFVLFGILAMYDFWSWEYEYGHNLDPNAAIVVPGMAYQPPLIGFKQLLNFGAYSIPDIGGWLFILAGLLMVVASYLEFKKNKFPSGTVAKVTVFMVISLLLGACGPSGPEPIEVHKDLCHHCKMNIADTRFAAELITGKGRVYKFDDVLCLQAYVSDLVADPKAEVYICDYADPGHLTPLDSLVFVQGDAIQSPMRGNIAAFRDEKQLQEYNEVWKGIQIDRGIIFAQ